MGLEDHSQVSDCSLWCYWNTQWLKMEKGPWSSPPPNVSSESKLIYNKICHNCEHFSANRAKVSYRTCPVSSGVLHFSPAKPSQGSPWIKVLLPARHRNGSPKSSDMFLVRMDRIILHKGGGEESWRKMDFYAWRIILILAAGITKFS